MASVKLTIGCIGITRDGQREGPMTRYEDDRMYPWVGSHGHVFKGNGESYVGPAGDIVAVAAQPAQENP